MILEALSLLAGLFGGQPKKTNNTPSQELSKFAKEGNLNGLSMTDKTSKSAQSNGGAQGNNGQSLNPSTATASNSFSESSQSGSSAKAASKSGDVASNARFSKSAT